MTTPPVERLVSVNPSGGFMFRKVALVVLCAGIGWTLWSCRPSPLIEPGGRAEDAYLAVNDPHEYAWRLFFYINHPAKTGLAGVADSTKKFGEFDPEGSLVWETWALASGDDRSEVFLPNGEHPGNWGDLARPKGRRTLRLSKNIERQMMFEEMLRKPLLFNQKNKKSGRKKLGANVNPSNRFRPQDLDQPEQEMRMNRAAFDDVVKREMYSADGLEELLRSAREKNDAFLIQMDRSAKEVKADWLLLTDESWKKRYLWREGPPGRDGKRPVYGLVALHIITKDLRDWFWADFGHIDCEDGKYACSDHPYVSTRGNDPVDTTTRGPGAAHGANGIRKETVGTVWENYILRGTQTAFVERNGEPTVLSNPVIENIEQHSSCITCHAFATVGLSGGDGRVANLGDHFTPGVPEPRFYQD